MEAIIKRMNEMEVQMNTLKAENETLKEKISESGAQSGGSVQTSASNAKVEKKKSHTVATSLISGMPTFHGIGAGMLTAAEDITFEKWYRRTEKSLTGSRVKVFDGTAWITWKQMFLRDVVLNDLHDTLFNEKLSEDVAALEPYIRKKYITGDILLCGFIEARVYARAANKIAASPTAFHKWKKLEDCYAKGSVAAQNLLTEQWNALKQGAGQTIDIFIEKIDFLAMEMAAAGIPPTDQARLYTLLSGTNTQWSTEIKILKRTHADYEESCAILLEAGVEASQRPREAPERGLLASGGDGRERVASYADEERGYAARAGRGGGRGWQQPDPTFTCYACGSKNHVTGRCPTGLTPSKAGRCFNCLGEGHTSRYCKDVKRVWGSFKREDVVRGAKGDTGTPGTGTPGNPRDQA
jgi:hypothetical protein